MVIIVKEKFININLLEMQIVEWVRTLIPAVLLLQIALPSLLLLYILDETADRMLTVKTVGHQWYWSYEYKDFWSADNNMNLEFDAYMITTSELREEMFRLLDVDNRTVIPMHTQVRVYFIGRRVTFLDGPLSRG